MDSCERCTQLLSARLDGELTARETRELEAHLASCPECRALAEELEAIHAAFPRLEEIPAPEGFAQGVMERIREEAGPKVIPLFRRPQFRALAGLAACAALCLGLYRAGMPGLPKLAAGEQESLAAASQTVEAECAEEKSLLAETPACYTARDMSGGTDDLDGAVAPPYDPAEEKDALVQSDFALYAVTAAAGETAPKEKAAPEEQAAPAHYAFSNDQYLRVSWREELDTTTAVILGSTEELTDYLARFPDDDLSALTAAYDGDYFETGRLLALTVTEPSGSIRHTLAFQGLLWDQVTVERQVPEVGTCDLAAWLILAEVEPPFNSGHTLKVVLEP